MILITGPNYTACRILVEALGSRGISAGVVDAANIGKADVVDVRWIVLAPQELPYGFKPPKGDYGVVDIDADLETQVAIVVRDLEWRSA